MLVIETANVLLALSYYDGFEYMKNFFLSSILFFAITNRAIGQTSDTVASQSRIKTLSFERYRAYLNGEDYDHMSAVGEMNHFPLPDKVLKQRKDLALTAEQVKKLVDIYTYMHRRQLQAGGSMIANEKMLDSLFKTQKLNDGIIIFYTNRYGLYTGELRNAVLQACYATRKVLTQQQLSKYENLQKSN